MPRLPQLVSMSILLACVYSCSRSTQSVDREKTVTSLEVQERFDRLLNVTAPIEEARLADQLEALGPGAIPYLEARLRAGNIREQALAMMILQRLNGKRSEAQFSESEVRTYLSWLSDQNVIVRTYAMEALIKSGKRFQPLIQNYQKHATAAIQERLNIVLSEMH